MDVYELCKQHGFDQKSLLERLDGKGDFRQETILKLAECLDIKTDEFGTYFFKSKLKELKEKIHDKEENEEN